MATELALSDLKILDFMWAMAGPAASRVLADYGAVVVRVESERRRDPMRSIPPFQKGEPGPENSAAFQNLNAGKLSITLDLSQPAGRAVCHDLVRWADVVMESYSPRVMTAWQLDYDALCHIKPDLIMLSTSLMGHTGPVSTFAGIGNLGAALAGFYSLTGWPDRPPAGPFSAYTDYVAPRYSVALVLAALDHRRRTGEGQYIDQSQIESSLHFLTPALLDYTVNDRVQDRVGNRDAQFAPHGIYPAMGEDQWVALPWRRTTNGGSSAGSWSSLSCSTTRVFRHHRPVS